MEPDLVSIGGAWQGKISIHGLRMEPDLTTAASAFIMSYFNPRAPYGARQSGKRQWVTLRAFQSTGSVWSPTLYGVNLPKLVIFQSTGSVWSPTQCVQHWLDSQMISIHGLRMEPDAENL